MEGVNLASIFFKLLMVAFLVFLNGFFVAAEFALVRIRNTQLEELERQGNKSVRSVKNVLKRLDHALSACQLGITAASLALGWIGEPVFTALLKPLWLLIGFAGPAYEQLRHSSAVVLGFLIMTFLHITAGEQAPKWFAIIRPLPVAIIVSRPLIYFQKITYPFIWLLNTASQWMLKLLRLDIGGKYEEGHSEQELRRILATAINFRSSSRLALTHELMLNVFELKERIARDIMQPRKEIVGFSDSWSILKCLEVAKLTRYSRFPIFKDGNLDQVLGVIHIKDLYANAARLKSAKDLLRYARAVVYAPEWARLDSLLLKLQARGTHLCIIVDEYGSTMGLVTLEDILEELVGEIHDEFDVDEESLIIKASDEEWIVDGICPIHEIEQLLGIELEHEDVSTMSGFVISKLQRLPKVGDKIEVNGVQIEVVQMENVAIRKLRIRYILP